MNRNVDAVCCEFKYSGVGVGLLVAAAMATALLVLAMPISTALRMALCAWIVALTCHACRSLCAVRMLRLERGGAVRLETAHGLRTGNVRDGSLVAPWLTIVRWRPDGARFDRTVLVLPGMVGEEDFRRLRVLLRWS
jgi:hypothetical protein